MQRKEKKKSIREFVSEDSIKFQLYLMKYSNLLKQIETKSKEELVENWSTNNRKRINRFKKDKFNPKYQNSIAQVALDYNIEYATNLKPLLTQEEVTKEFELIRLDYIESLKIRIDENKTNTLSLDKSLLEYATNIKIHSNVSKDKFGEMILLIIKNLASMPGFSGYSDNWKTDFFSNAIEKILLYLNNFDEELKSKITGSKSKAFAYITQITFNAFVNIINERKKDENFLRKTKSLEALNLEGLLNKEDGSVFTSTFNIDNNIYKYILDLSDKTNIILEESINEAYKLIIENNKLVDDYELDTIKKEESEDLVEIKNIESKLSNYKLLSNTNKINVLDVIIDREVSLSNFIKPNLEDVSLIIRRKKEIIIEEKEELKIFNVNNIIKSEEMEDFNNEW